MDVLYLHIFKLTDPSCNNSASVQSSMVLASLLSSALCLLRLAQPLLVVLMSSSSCDENPHVLELGLLPRNCQNRSGNPGQRLRHLVVKFHGSLTSFANVLFEDQGEVQPDELEVSIS